MKLESLNDSKFEAFKGMEVKNPLMVIGGEAVATRNDVYTLKDGQWVLKSSGNADTWITNEQTNTAISVHWGQSGDMVSIGGGPGPGGEPEEWSDPNCQVEFFLV